jgi:ubiquinone/menaquinone biosynthesis C-methylase UbiE
MDEATWGSSDVAARWKQGAAERNRLMEGVTERMFAEAGVRPGSHVLEIGCGAGDVAMLLSARVGPAGHVTATDGSAAMVDATSTSLRAAGATNVTVRVCDATALDFPAASFDAAVGRQVLMFLDLAKALPGIRGVLRDGGRFGAVVWGPTANNPFHRIVLDAALDEGGWGDAKLQLVQAFSRGDAGMYENALGQAGFRDVSVSVVHGVREFSSLEETMKVIRESPIHADPIAHVAEGRQARAWERVEREIGGFAQGGPVKLPSEWLVIGARR